MRLSSGGVPVDLDVAVLTEATALAGQTSLVWHSASYPDPYSTTALELTFQLDHPLGAAQPTIACARTEKKIEIKVSQALDEWNSVGAS